MHISRGGLAALLSCVVCLSAGVPPSLAQESAPPAESPPAATATSPADHIVEAGTHIIDAATLQSVAGIFVSAGATAVIDVAAHSDLVLPGNFTNHGTVYFGSSSASVGGASLSAANIFNQPGALISTVLPAEGLAGFVNATGGLNLTLTAVQDIINSGTIASAGNLSMTAGGSIVNALPGGNAGAGALIHALGNVALNAANIANSGVIAALAGNVNVASQTARNISINNTAGAIEALAGAINIRDAAFSEKFNVDLFGGDLRAQELNIFSGAGRASLDVRDIVGRLNIHAGEAHVSSATSNLTLGDMVITGDPSYFNRLGSVTIAGSLNFAGQALAIVAQQDVLTAAGAGAINTGSSTGNGGSILIVAGADFTTSGPDSGSNDTTTTLTITGASASGGRIDLDGGTPITSLTSASTVPSGSASGGDIQLIAFAGSATDSGKVIVPTAVTITSGGQDTGTNGSVSIIAGAASGTSITTGEIDTTGGANGTGDIEVRGATPAIVGSNVTVLDGAITAGSFSAGTVQESSLSTGNLDAGGSITMTAGSFISLTDSQTIRARGGDIEIGAPQVSLGNGSTIENLGSGIITLTSGGTMSGLTIVSPDSGTATVSTSGGAIEIEPTAGYGITFAKSAGAGTTTLNLMGGPVSATAAASAIHIQDDVTVASDNTVTLTVDTSGGILGVAFQPYVGPFVGGIPVLFNVYTLQQVEQLLTPVAQDFSVIATYGQGFAPGINSGDPPFARDSNQYIIQAASTVGIKVAAGVNQWVISGSNWDLDVSKAEIDYIIQQAKTYGNVTEIIVTNESITDLTSAQNVLSLIQYAQQQRDAAGFNSQTLPVTTRQEWGTLAGVNNPGTGYQSVLKQILSTVDGFVYANMYAYFDPNIASAIGSSPTQQQFTTAVTTSMSGTLTSLQNAFQTESVTTAIRIGETGWPTSGSQGAQPDASLATVQFAQWYYEAMQTWSAQNSVPTVIFEAYDEPWKGNEAGTNSEAFFGIWTAQGTAANAGQYTLTGETMKYTLGGSGLASARQILNEGIISAANVAMNTPILMNHGSIVATDSGAFIETSSNKGLLLGGAGSMSLTGGGAGTISASADGANALEITGAQTWSPGSTGSAALKSQDTGGMISFAAGVEFSIADGAALLVSAPVLHFMGDGSALKGSGASDIDIDSGQGMNALAIIAPSGGSATISTGGGTIDIAPTPGFALLFLRSAAAGTATLNLMGGEVTTTSTGSGTHVLSGVNLVSDNSLTMNVEDVGGIYGVAFQPYVGPWDNGVRLPQNAYSLADVTGLLTTVPGNGTQALNAQFDLIATYSQGTFVFNGKPIAGNDSDKWNIAAAAAAGIKIAAGVFQQGTKTNPDGSLQDYISVKDTKVEIDWAIAQALANPGTVTEIIVGNESIWGPVSTQAIIDLVNYAKAERDKHSELADIKITTRQRWDVLAGVNNPNTGYQSKLKTLLSTVDGFVYANMYAYFDPNIASAIGTNPTQTEFTTAVTNSMNTTLTALQNSFQTEGVTAAIRIGETGWPTSGSQSAQPDAALANNTFAQWYFDAMKTWSVTNNIKTVIFEAFDEPQKNTSATGTSSEAYFGLYTASGTISGGQFDRTFTLTGTTQKFPLSGTSSSFLSNSGSIAASFLTMNTPHLANHGSLAASAPAATLAVNGPTDLRVSGDGSMSLTGGGAGVISMTAGGAGGLTLTGTQTFDPGASGETLLNATEPGASILVGANLTFNGTATLNAGNGLVTLGSNSFIDANSHLTINACGLVNPHLLDVDGTLLVNVLLSCPPLTGGAGTIASTAGPVVLAKNMVINTHGLDLAIISSGDVVSQGPVTIDLSGRSGDGGSLNVFAGVDFSPVTFGQVVDTHTNFQVNGPSSQGGKIDFSAVRINTGTRASGAAGGAVTLVANAGSQSPGSITVHSIDTSARSGRGGDVTLIGEGGVSVLSGIHSSGAIEGGQVGLFGAAAVKTGTIVALNGVVFGGGSFDPACAACGSGSIVSVAGSIETNSKSGAGGSVTLTADRLISVGGSISTGGGSVAVDTGAGAFRVGKDLSTSGYGINSSNSTSDAGNAGDITITGTAFVSIGGNLLAKGGSTRGSGSGGDGGEILLASSPVSGANNYPVGSFFIGGHLDASGGTSSGGAGGAGGTLTASVGRFKVARQNSGVSVNVSGGLGAANGAPGVVDLDTFAVQQLPVGFDLTNTKPTEFALPGGMFSVGEKQPVNGTAGSIVSGPAAATALNASRIVQGLPFSDGGITITVTGSSVQIDRGAGLETLNPDNGSGVRTMITPGQALAAFQVSREGVPTAQTVGLDGSGRVTDSSPNGGGSSRLTVASYEMNPLSPFTSFNLATTGANAITLNIDGETAFLDLGSAKVLNIAGTIDFRDPGARATIAVGNQTLAVSQSGAILASDEGSLILSGDGSTWRVLGAVSAHSIELQHGSRSLALLLGITGSIGNDAVSATAGTTLFIAPSLTVTGGIFEDTIVSAQTSGKPGDLSIASGFGSTAAVGNMSYRNMSLTSGTLTVAAGASLAAGGDLFIAAGGTLTVEAGSEISSGRNLTLTATGAVDIGSGAASLSGSKHVSVVSVTDSVTIGQDSTVQSAGGNVIVSGMGVTIESGAKIKAGTLSTTAPAAGVLSSGDVLVSGSVSIVSVGGSGVDIQSTSGDGVEISSAGGDLNVRAFLGSIELGEGASFRSDGGNLQILATGDVSGGTGNEFVARALGKTGGGIEMGAGLAFSNNLAAAFLLPAGTAPSPSQLGSNVVINNGGGTQGVVQSIVSGVGTINLSTTGANQATLNLNGGAMVFDAIGSGATVELDGGTFTTDALRPIAYRPGPAAVPSGIASNGQIDDGAPDSGRDKLKRSLPVAHIYIAGQARAHTLKERGESAPIIATMSGGQAFIHAEREMSIETHLGQILLRRGALVSVSVSRGALRVAACSGPGDVVVVSGGHSLPLSAGCEAQIFRSIWDESDRQPNDGIGRRSARTHALGGGLNATISDFSMVSLLLEGEHMHGLRCRETAAARRLQSRYAKTAAAVLQLSGSRGIYTARARQ